LHRRDEDDEDVLEVGCAALQRGKLRKPRLGRPGLGALRCVDVPRVGVPAGRVWNKSSSSSRDGSGEDQPCRWRCVALLHNHAST
jgi:hypothetical protein